MSASKTFAVIIISFLASSLLIYSPMLIDGLNRNQKEQVAKAHLATLKMDLYVPQGVAILSESEFIRPPNYFNDCFGAGMEIIYGSNRPRDEIHAEYARDLINAGWERDSGYKSVDYYQVYKMGDEGNLAIDTSETIANPTGQDFQVIYSVWITFMTPSYDRCVG